MISKETINETVISGNYGIIVKIFVTKISYNKPS